MQRQGHGQIVNTASMAGLVPGGLTSCYTASKHAVVGLSLSLRAEARQYGIGVTVLCPGYLRTPIHETTPIYSAFMEASARRSASTGSVFPTPEACVDRLMRGVERDHAIVVAPRSQVPFWWLHRLAPSAVPAFFSLVIAHEKRSASRASPPQRAGERLPLLPMEVAR